MAVFPLFVELKGKNCFVIGGGKVAARKIEILLRFEANINIIAPEVDTSILEFVNQAKINIKRKEYSDADIEGAFLVVAATSSPEVNERVYRDAVKRKIPVNVVDDPQKCSFIFPSVIKRGDLSIGISTAGTYPVLSKKIRKITEKIITEEYTGILSKLSDFRSRLKESDLDQVSKAEILKNIVDEFYDAGVISQEALKILIEKYERELHDGRLK